MKRLALALAFTVVAACKPPPEGQAPALSPGPSSQPAGASSQPAQPLAVRVVAAPDRDPADRALDGGRHAVELLEFFDVQPGMRVGEIAAGGGYTTELLARAVGEGGKVYAQNHRFVLERFAEKPWSERLKKPVMKNVVRVDRELDDPLPPEAKNLDLVVNVLFYHDTVWQKADRAKMNAAIFAALKPGGSYIVVDHAAKDGAGTSVAETLHRIDEQTVKQEVLAAGFELGSEGAFLRNAADPRDWNASPRDAADKRGTSDRFVLEFKKRAE